MQIKVDESTHEEIELTVTEVRAWQDGGEAPDAFWDEIDKAQGYAFGSHGRPATLLIRIKPDAS